MFLVRTKFIDQKIRYLLETFNLHPPLTNAEMEKIMNLSGIKINYKDLGNCHGFTYFENDIYYIFINNRLPYREMEFTIAHELGHIILGHCRQQLHNVSQTTLQMLEAEANVFAGKLLNTKVRRSRLKRFA